MIFVHTPKRQEQYFDASNIPAYFTDVRHQISSRHA
jgi:hypothetical protein